MKFNYMNKNNEILTSVYVSPFTKKVKFKNYTDFPLDCVFGVKKKATYEDVMNFFEDRCVPRNRKNINDILELLGLKEYDPYLICKFNHGRTAQDENWIDFLEDWLWLKLQN